ncbi:probable cytochrome P450 4aa1 [Fopius arisanus]|uniref:Probable cytochrome P450 4aa1 n=1 Tax=Fopius arisanus TaxID=64838 RepID=A0A9R1U9G6_9HYME|nr:PREDICTED: probable cytochrome P450 4aa1 [Fopius arisanus]
MWERVVSNPWIIPVILIIICGIWRLKNYLRAVTMVLTMNGPKIVPFLGNTGYLYDDNLLKTMSHMAYAMYGSSFRLWVTVLPFVVLLEPQDIQQVLGSSKHTDKVLFYKLLHNFLGKGLITSDVLTWRAHRKILQPIFHVNVLEQFVRIFNNSAGSLVKCLEESRDLGIDITRVVNDSVYEILNETVLGNTNKSEISSSPFRRGQLLFSYRLTHPWLLLEWIYRRTSLGMCEQNHRKDLTLACQKVLKSPKNSASISLLKLMIEAKEKHQNFSNEDIINECCTFMLAGQDSVGSAVALSLFMLAKHKKWQGKCHQELERIFRGDERQPTLGDLREMRYLEMSIKETLRMYPSVPFFARTLGEDIQVGSRIIPKGCGILIMPYSTHRLPHHYPNPHEFNPERFNSENSSKRHPYAYLPFSAGPRNCIGYKFAMLEMKAIISAVLRRFHLDIAPGREEITPKFRVTVRVKGGVWIKAHPRDNP